MTPGGLHRVKYACDRFVTWAVLIVFCAGPFLHSATFAGTTDDINTSSQTPSSTSQPTLSDRQLLVRDRVSRLEDRMFQLSQALRKTEPEKAQRLIEALGALRGDMLRDKMEEIAKKLGDDEFADAVDKQGTVASDLQSLLKILLEDPNHLDEIKQEAERLKEFRATLGKIVQEQEAEIAAAEATKQKIEKDEKGKTDPENKSELQKQADTQQSTADKTQRLADEMKSKDAKPAGKQKESPQSKDDKKESPDKEKKEANEDKSDKDDKEQLPGQQQIEQASPLQKDASQKLKEEKVEEAVKKQKEAVDKLKQAQDELTNRLDQLRKEQQEEMLAALETRFRAMLTRQLECNKATKRLADVGQPNWKRSDQLESTELSQKQRWVGDEADSALFVLKDEGTTVIVPQLLGQVRDDGRETAERLAAQDVGNSVLVMQDEIEQVLRDIIDAIKKKQEELEENPNQNDSNKNGEDQQQPLLPGSAEMKLLRACQMRVNAATMRLKNETPSSDMQRTEFVKQAARLAKQQEQVAKMAKDMHEAMTKAQ